MSPQNLIGGSTLVWLVYLHLCCLVGGRRKPGDKPNLKTVLLRCSMFLYRAAKPSECAKMHKEYILVILAVFGCTFSIVRAEEAIHDPEVNYIDTPQKVCAEFGILKSEEVLRIDLDVDGSGAAVVFLTFKGTGSKGGANWTAYCPANDGSYTRIDNLQFRSDTFRSGKVAEFNPTGGLLVYYPGKGGGELFRYQFLKGTVTHEHLRSLDTSVAEDGRLFETIFGRNWNEPLPAEYFDHPPYQVVAVRDIRARMPQSAEVINTIPKVQKPFPGPAAAEQKTTSANALPKTVPSDEHDSRSSTFWIICLIAIAVALGSLWYIVARRS